MRFSWAGNDRRNEENLDDHKISPPYHGSRPSIAVRGAVEVSNYLQFHPYCLIEGSDRFPLEIIVSSSDEWHTRRERPNDTADLCHQRTSCNES
jgi:hypothetical protein